MTHRSIEWNLGFAYTEVVERVAKMLDKMGSKYIREATDSETTFRAGLSHGRLELTARPASVSKGSVILQAVRHRTLLGITFVAVNAEEEKDFMRLLTTSFLRIGG